MQQKETINREDFSEITSGRIIAIDLGTKRIGVAICDELQLTIRPLEMIPRRSWKILLKQIEALIENFDAVAVVVGLPFHIDGRESDMSVDARKVARNLSLSVSIPVFLQDERLTTRSARDSLYERGANRKEISKQLDSEAAILILSDFLDRKKQK